MGRKKLTTAAKIRNFFAKHPNATPAECITALGVKPANVYLERSKMKREMEKALTNVSAEPEQKDTNWKVVAFNTTEAPVIHDPVNSPAHYLTGGIETIDFIEAKGFNYRLGNAVKYIARAQHKGNYLEDLKKAVWYLQREIDAAA